MYKFVSFFITLNLLVPLICSTVLDVGHQNIDVDLYNKWQKAVEDYDLESGRDTDLGLVNVTRGRESRILSLFTLVQFQNKACSGSSGTGVCYTSGECTSKGGSATGSCAFGYGTCCYFEAQCGAHITQNCTYIVSPNYPDTYNEARDCSFTMDKNSDTCQIRMDVEDFSSTQPSAQGVCTIDTFTFDKDRKFTYLCGEKPSENWHFYLDVKDQSNPFTFKFTTTGTAHNRKFKIKLSLIPCSLRVPGGCGQYFTEDSSDIQTFNYGSGPYMAGLNYGICIRKNKGKCKTQFDQVAQSFVFCTTDMYRIPYGIPPTHFTGIAAITQTQAYCQLPGLIDDQPDTATTFTNGPVNLHLYTVIDANTNVNPSTFASGVHQKYTQLNC